MSLTAFQRYRRMKQVEEMKPENITSQDAVANTNSAETSTEDTQANSRRRRKIEE